jgi:hypothetical protein
MTSTTVTTAERIRALNDAFRRTFVGGMVMITAGVEAMPVNTTLARSTRAASATFGKSIATTARPSSAPPIRPTPPSPRAS